jgi:hypothetical protein
MNFARLFAFVGVSLLIASMTRADTLGSWTPNITGMENIAYVQFGSPPPPPANIGFHFFFGGNGAGGTGSIDIGDSVWTTTTIGGTTTIDSSTPNFDAVAALLTDGIDENIGFGITHFGSNDYLHGIALATRSFTESDAFDLPISAPDFAGDQITGIQFQLDSLSWVVTQTGSTSYSAVPSATFTESVIGTVPEPTSAILAIAGPVWLLFARPPRSTRFP